MTPQERDLITHLLERLRQAGGQGKDAEAEALIRQAVAAQPDAPYYLVQTVLIQDMALSQAQSRIHELEQQLAASRPAPSQPTSCTRFGVIFSNPHPAAFLHTPRSMGSRTETGSRTKSPRSSVPSTFEATATCSRTPLSCFAKTALLIEFA